MLGIELVINLTSGTCVPVLSLCWTLSLHHCTITFPSLLQSLHEREEQVEGLTAHVKDLRSEISLLTSRMTSHHTHNNNTLVKDLVRLGSTRLGRSIDAQNM